MHLFWKQGYHATSMQELVDELGINRASLYDTYGDKHSLFKESVAHYRKQNLDYIRGFFEEGKRIKDAFETIFNRLVDQTMSDVDCKGCFIVNTTAELLPVDESMQGVLAQNKHDYEGLYTQYIQQAIDRGEFSKTLDAKGVASYLYSVQGGLKLTSKVEAKREELASIVKHALMVFN